MMWPWKRHAREALEAKARADTAEALAAAATKRRQDAERLAAQSRSTTAALRHQIQLNGWTELLQQAWGAR